MKRLRLAALAAAALLAGCDPSSFVERMAAAHDDSGRVPAEWLMYGPDEPGMCNGMLGASIPCRDVLNVCVASADGRLEPKWFLPTYVCTPSSPTWRDVCRTRPEVEWAFYGYTREECEGA